MFSQTGISAVHVTDEYSADVACSLLNVVRDYVIATDFFNSISRFCMRLDCIVFSFVTVVPVCGC